MPLLLDTSRSAATNEFRAANCVTIGLVNNMPDPALEATERQFVDLIRAAAAKTIVRLLLFSIPANSARRHHAPGHGRALSRRVRALGRPCRRPDRDRHRAAHEKPQGRAVLGDAEPGRGLGARYTTSTIWSCLAAHAAVLHVDGIERRPLAGKLFGVFDCEPAASHPMTSDAKSGLRVPHSRYNDLPEPALVACGYRILTRSAVAGVDMFARQDKSFHLFLQGHPEYEAKDAAARIPPRRRPLPAARARRLSRPAAGIFRRQSGGDCGRVPRARAPRPPRAPHRQFSDGRA